MIGLGIDRACDTLTLRVALFLLLASLTVSAPLAFAADPYHVIYVHGKAVEDGGRRPTTSFGIYEYDAILEALRSRGFVVSSEQRPRDADPQLYAQRVRDEVRKLIGGGVSPSHITVIGASKGAVITMLASTLLQEPDVRYVLMGNCNDSIFRDHATRLSGHVLSVYETTDTFGHSCERFFQRAGALSKHDEIALHLGIGHSFLYTPNPAWLEPAARWARNESGAGKPALPEPVRPVVIRNVTVIDGTGRAPQAAMDVVVRGKIIDSVTPSRERDVYTGARVIDGTGKYLIPGLIDMHAHMLLNPWNEKGEIEPRYDRAASLELLKLYLRFGVTTIRDPGSQTGEALLFRRLAAEGRIDSPTIFTAGRILNSSSFNPEPFVIVRTADAVREEIRWQAQAGVDAIKVYASMPPELVKVAIEEAHKYGLPVLGHTQRTTWTEAAQLGIDGLEHAAPWSTAYIEKQAQAAHPNSLFGRVYWLQHLDQHAVDEMIEALVAHHVVVDPTLMAMHTKFWGDDVRYTKSADLSFVPEKIRIGWAAGRFTADWTAEQYAESQKAWPILLAFVKKMYDKGVPLVTGTDAPTPWIVPGASLHDELRLLADAGIPPLAIISMATRDSARALRREHEFGSIVPGRFADLVLLTKDPVASISNTRAIEMVMKRGEMINLTNGARMTETSRDAGQR